MILQLTPDLDAKFSDWLLLVQELREFAVIQRRNKFAWANASFQAWVAETHQLRASDPEYEAIPLDTLLYVLWSLDQEYQTFLSELKLFKKKKRVNPPKTPAFKSTKEVLFLKVSDLEGLLSTNEIKRLKACVPLQSTGLLLKSIDEGWECAESKIPWG